MGTAESDTTTVVSGVLAEIYGAVGLPLDLHPDDLTAEQQLDVFIELHRRSRSLDDLVKQVKKRLDDLEPEVMTHMQETGTQSINRRGMTVYLAREDWPSAFDDDLVREFGDNPTKAQLESAKAAATDRLLKALSDDQETAHLVRSSFNHQTLRSFVLNDCKFNEESMEYELPDHLRGKLAVITKFRAKARLS